MSDVIEYLKTNPETLDKIRGELVELSTKSLSTKAKRCEELAANSVVYHEVI